jgi:hypothetical protein
MKFKLILFWCFLSFNAFALPDKLEDSVEVIGIGACAYLGYSIEPVLAVVSVVGCEIISEFFIEKDDLAQIENEHQAKAYIKKQLYDNITLIVIVAIILGWLFKSPFAITKWIFDKFRRNK